MIRPPLPDGMEPDQIAQAVLLLLEKWKAEDAAGKSPRVDPIAVKARVTQVFRPWQRSRRAADSDAAEGAGPTASGRLQRPTA